MVNINNIFCRNRIGYLGQVEFNRIFLLQYILKFIFFVKNLKIKIYKWIIGQKPKQKYIQKKYSSKNLIDIFIIYI